MGVPVGRLVYPPTIQVGFAKGIDPERSVRYALFAGIQKRPNPRRRRPRQTCLVRPAVGPRLLKALMVAQIELRQPFFQLHTAIVMSRQLQL